MDSAKSELLKLGFSPWFKESSSPLPLRVRKYPSLEQAKKQHGRSTDLNPLGPWAAPLTLHGPSPLRSTDHPPRAPWTVLYREIPP